MAEVDSVVARLHRHVVADRPAADPRMSQRLEIESKFDAPRLLMGFNTVRTDHPDYYALEVLQALLTAGKPGRLYRKLVEGEEIAGMVHMNERTMRRKLEGEGTSFGEILDDVRASLASEYLKTTKMTTEDIASLVGFSDAANFRRAFRRWTGKAPKEFRSPTAVSNA